MNISHDSDLNKDKKTFFAPAERSSPEELKVQSEIVLRNPLIRCALDVFVNNMMVLNENRQIIACNVTLMKTLGIDDPKKLIGKRPGEVLNCVNVKDGPSGCGTSIACRSCGAVITILAAQQLQNKKSGYCQITSDVNGIRSTRLLYIECFPVDTQTFTPLIFTMKELGESDIKAMDRDRLLFGPS